VLFGQGCASLTPEGAKVRITNNPQATVGCKFLGEVKGKFENELRNEAAELGANLVFSATQPVERVEACKCEERP
jgi:hypothetical protein